MAKTIQESCFLETAERWRDELKHLPDHKDADEGIISNLSLSCILIASEFRSSLGFSEKTIELIRNNIELPKTLGRSDPVLDGLPWMLIFDLTPINGGYRDKEWSHFGSEDILSRILNHHVSGIRLWGLKLAWFIKEFISRDKFIDSLFHNIEKSYFFSAESWALAETFFGSEEELMMAAQNWSSDCQKIFQQEVKNISENCRDNSIFFWRVEAKIRKDINELLLKKFTSRESG